MQQKEHKVATIRGVCAEIPSKNIVPKMFIFFTNLTIHDYVSNYSKIFYPLSHCLLVFMSLYFARVSTNIDCQYIDINAKHVV
jgi:hypothetical protein